MNEFWGRTVKFAKEHGATALSILAGLGVVATGITAYNAGQDEANQRACSGDEVPKPRWKILIKPVSFGAATIGCIAGSRYLGRRTEKELLAASAVLASYLARESGSEEVDGAERGYEQSGSESDIEDTGTGEIIFEEDFTGRKFRASMNVYEYAIRKFQDNFSICGFGPLNDLYALLNIKETYAGEVLAWTTDQMILDPDYIPGDNFSYDKALTQLAIQLEEVEKDKYYIIHYNVLPIGSLAGIGPCNY